jgi:predicted acylesterase/phospholipase RssA
MSYRLAITIAGAVSLGSFEGGVLFEVVDALGQHNQAASPDQRIYIDVLTGASAGGMTAAIAAQNLLYTAPAFADPYNNPFYNAWVAGVDINGLLPLQKNEKANQSVLSSDFVRGLSTKLLLGRYANSSVATAVAHPAVNPNGTIRLGLALSNLDGIDYQRPVLSGGTFNYTRFEDQILFPLGPTTDTRADWTPISDAAVACGAFPLLFVPAT